MKAKDACKLSNNFEKRVEEKLVPILNLIKEWAKMGHKKWEHQYHFMGHLNPFNSSTVLPILRGPDKERVIQRLESLGYKVSFESRYINEEVFTQQIQTEIRRNWFGCKRRVSVPIQIVENKKVEESVTITISWCCESER